MGGELLIVVMLVIGVLELIAILTKSKIMEYVTRVGLSAMMIVVMNYLLPQYMIGFNIYTIGFSTLLGMPGLMTLYVLEMLI